MGLRKEIREEIGKLRIDVLRLTTIFEKHVENLQKEKKDLLDRFMARSFEELKIYSPSTEGEETTVEVGLDEDEMMAGEVLDLERKE